MMRRLAPGDVRLPAISTVHCVLDRHGLVARIGRRRQRAQGTPLSGSDQPNDLWCADFKGEFKLGDGRFCYPLTVTDQVSRFILMCDGQTSTKAVTALPAFERLFKERGLPKAIRSFNQERPHEALGMKRPADLYAPSNRPYRGLPEVEYPLHDRDALVIICGRICMPSQENQHFQFPGGAAPWNQGRRRRHLARFLHGLRPRRYRSGADNLTTSRQPAAPACVTHVTGTIRHPCLRYGPRCNWRRRRESNPRPCP